MAKYEDGVMYYFIINPASQSDRGYKIWKKIEQRLVRDGVEYQAYLTEYAGQATGWFVTGATGISRSSGKRCDGRRNYYSLFL